MLPLHAAAANVLALTLMAWPTDLTDHTSQDEAVAPSG